MKQSGVSLIELMVVVALIGLLALMSAPLTGAWVNGARVGETLGAMEQAVGQAKAAALRNPAAMQGNVAASVICLSAEGVISVRSADVAAASCAGALASQLWFLQLDRRVSVKIGQLPWSCSCFTNKGLLTNEGAACAACSNSLTFTISAGAENETFSFY